MDDHIETDRYQVQCPKCGAEAQWDYVDEDRASVEVICPDCGRMQMSREDCDQTETGAPVQGEVKIESVTQPDD